MKRFVHESEQAKSGSAEHRYAVASYVPSAWL